MARIVFTAAERARIEAIMVELDPARHELLEPYSQRLRGDEWEFVKAYVRRELRALCELTAMAMALAETAADRGLANEEGVGDFLDSRTWIRNFDVADASDERFMEIAAATGRPAPGANYDLSTDADTLLEIAEQRMKGTFEEAFAELLREMES